ncbi:unnamed protein product [Cyclocybe aegerita]|uniref:SAGA-associated factor 11 n=1 Tax=Cyclocybe aegerita TaxID=1973307 RepID=A0A8S0W6H6_CYCAE|nr:unnamed protein product [Cyclocybe aegerita]
MLVPRRDVTCNCLSRTGHLLPASTPSTVRPSHSCTVVLGSQQASHLPLPSMPKSERDETLAALTAKIFSAMLDELVTDATLQSHHEVARSRAVCPVCHTRCGSIHTPGSASAINNEALQASVAAQAALRADTPSSSGSNDVAAKSNVNGTGTSTPTSGKDGNLYLECVSCSRQIASNRYAPHLASCMGLNSARRAPVRSNAKSKQASDAGRSASPGSDGGNVSDDKSKGKAKAKSKKPADESEFNLKRKRPTSPQISPNKKAKKGKVSGSPVSRVKADPDLSGLPSNSHFSPSINSQSKVPSKLRDSSTASFLERSSASSRESSPGGISVPTPASSFSSQQSPTRPLAGNSKAAGRPKPPAMGTGPPKRPSPPVPRPPIHVPDYNEIDHANETGSSTDTDSD